MGYSGTSTYVKFEKKTDLIEGLQRAFIGLGYAVAVSEEGLEWPPKQFFPKEIKQLGVFAIPAGSDWWRLYSNGPANLFALHAGDNVPLLERIAREGGAEAFEISVFDGEDVFLLETRGNGYRLTGGQGLLMDLLYEMTNDFNALKDDEEIAPPAEFVPGMTLSFSGQKLDYQSMDVEPGLVEFLKGHDFFEGPLDEAISIFEIEKFGHECPDWHEAKPGQNDPVLIFEETLESRLPLAD